MKALKIILRIILIFVLIVILSAVGLGLFVYFSVSDSTNNTPQSVIDNNYSTTQVVHNQMVKSLNSTSNDVQIGFDGQAINELVYGFIQGLDIPSTEIKGAYAKFDDDKNLYIEIPVKVSFIDTNLKLTLAGKEENRNFSFTIKDAKIGNLSAFNWLTDWAINKFVNEENIESTLASNGIKCDISLANKTISFTKENLLSFMEDKLKAVSNYDLYSVLIKYALNHDNILDFDIGESSSIGFNLLMDSISWNESTYGSIPYPIDLEAIQSDIKLDMETKSITPDNITAVYTYYINGYESLDSADKETIQGLGYDTTYTGVKPDSSEAVKNYIESNDPSATEIASAIIAGSYTFKVPETTFNAVFASSDFIGKAMGFASKTDTSYICFESMYVDISSNSLDLRMIVNMGGRRMIVTTDTTAPVSSSYVINANVNAMGLGNVEITSEDQTTLLTYLQTVNTEDYLTIDPTNKVLSLDLAKLIGGDSNLNLLSQSLTKKTLKFTDENNLEITYSK